MWCVKMLRIQSVSAAGTSSEDSNQEAGKRPYHGPLRWGNKGGDISDKEWEERRQHLQKMFGEFQKQDGVDDAEREKRWKAFSERMANQERDKKPRGPFSFFNLGNREGEGKGDMDEKELEERRQHFRKIFQEFQKDSGIDEAEREKRWKAFSEHMASHDGDKPPGPFGHFMWGCRGRGEHGDIDDKEWEKRRQHVQRMFQEFQEQDGVDEAEREKRWKAFSERMANNVGDGKPPGPFGPMWGNRGGPGRGDMDEKELEERRQHFRKIFQEFQKDSGIDEAEREKRWKAFSQHMASHDGDKPPGPFGHFMWGGRGRGEQGDIDDKEWEKRRQLLQKIFEDFQNQDGVDEAEREKRWKAFSERMANHNGDKHSHGPPRSFMWGKREGGEKSDMTEKEWEERRKHFRNIFEEFQKDGNEAERDRRWKAFSESVANQDGEGMSQEHWHRVFASHGRRGGRRGGRGGFGFPGWRSGRKGVEDQRLFKEFDFY